MPFHARLRDKAGCDQHNRAGPLPATPCHSVIRLGRWAWCISLHWRSGLDGHLVRRQRMQAR